MRAIENGKGKGHDASSWQETVQEAYQAAHQRLDELQQGAAEAIMRNLHGYEDHEVTQSRAGLSAHKEAAPRPETGQYTSPLPSGGIEHLDLSAAGSNPVMVGRMPSGIEGVPDWPVILGDGEHAPKLTKSGRDIGGGHGRLHISARHGDEIRGRGFSDIDSYIRHIFRNMNQIRQDEAKGGHDTGSYFSVHIGDARGRKDKHDTAVLHLMKEDGYYRVGTSSAFETKYLEKRKLLWDGSRLNLSHPAEKNADLPPSSPNKSGSDAVYTSSRHNSTSDNGNLASKSQAIIEAQTYSDQIDRQLAALGDQISPEELAEIQREKTLSDGNVDALTSAAACLTRKAP